MNDGSCVFFDILSAFYISPRTYFQTTVHHVVASRYRMKQHSADGISDMLLYYVALLNRFKIAVKSDSFFLMPLNHSC